MDEFEAAIMRAGAVMAQWYLHKCGHPQVQSSRDSSAFKWCKLCGKAEPEDWRAMFVRKVAK